MKPAQIKPRAQRGALYKDSHAQKLVLASNNAGKLREFSALLAPGLPSHRPGELNVPEAEEPFHTFIETPWPKPATPAGSPACRRWPTTPGLCVGALGGAPGVLSARFARRTVRRPQQRRPAGRAGRENPRSGHYYVRWCWCATPTTHGPSSPTASGAARCSAPRARRRRHWLTRCSRRRAKACPWLDGRRRQNAVSHRGQAMRALAAKLAELGRALIPLQFHPRRRLAAGQPAALVAVHPLSPGACANARIATSTRTSRAARWTRTAISTR